ncbi:signal peptidase I [Xylanibacillus composti]|uniref:Signal peptidase I n=1 Tax=Xylanibacillus composti TaxID=1572762 RepID=A0A8J4M427_9BACL|nr:signal peptidase I [Xylanibacillus composti]
MKIFVSMILALVLLASGISPTTTKSFVASGPSMAPTIHDGDRIVVDTSHDLEIEREDLILLVVDGKEYVKRVVGLEGDVVEKTTRDSITIHEERYESVIWGDVTYPISLAKDEFFVLGDNLNHSLDSRTFGVITREQIIGKVISIQSRNKGN